MAAALYSLLSGKKAREKLAMTGELSLIGKVLPVGGIKEKVLAAKRAGIRTVVLPKLNAKDLKEVPEYAKKGMTFHLVSHVEEVFELALEGPARPKKPSRLQDSLIRSVVRKVKRPPMEPPMIRASSKATKAGKPTRKSNAPKSSTAKSRR
jgi:predicted ATP-dependent protease